MPPLGSPVIFHVPEARHMRTRKHDKSEVIGSAYHPELADFAGIVTRVGEDDRCDLVIFPPNRPPVTVNNVPPEEIEDLAAIAADADDEDDDDDEPARG